MNERVLVENLVERFPEFAEMYECHVFDNGGLLAYVFFAVDGVVDEVVGSYLGRDDLDWTENLDWRGVLRFLEGAFIEGDKEARDVIGTAFVHDLPWPGQPGHRIVGELGPALAELYMSVRG